MLAHNTPAVLPPDAVLGDASYGVVREAWVPEFYARFRSDLSRTLVGWDERFDCNRFAALFATKDRTIGLESFIENGPGKAKFVGE